MFDFEFLLFGGHIIGRKVALPAGSGLVWIEGDLQRGGRSPGKRDWGRLGCFFRILAIRYSLEILRILFGIIPRHDNIERFFIRVVTCLLESKEDIVSLSSEFFFALILSPWSSVLFD